MLLQALLRSTDHSSTVSALKQQLQQAGLWTALPGILSCAAVEMGVFRLTAERLAGCESDEDDGSDQPIPPFDELPQYAGNLVSLLAVLSKLWDSSSLLHSPLASSAEPAVRLAAAAVQFLSSYQDLPHGDLEAGVAAGKVLLFSHLTITALLAAEMLSEAASAAGSSAAPACSRGASASSRRRQHGAAQQQQQQQLAQLLLSPHWRCVTGFLVVAHCYAMLRSQQQPAAASSAGVGEREDSGSNGSSSSRSSNKQVSSGDDGCSSSGSPSHGSGEAGSSVEPQSIDALSQAYSRATAFAATWQRELPASHQQLLQLLECSNKGALWTAGLLLEPGVWPTDDVQEPIAGLHMLANAYSSVTSWARECASQAGEQGGSASSACAGAATSSTEAAVDVLLASVLLHCTANYSARHCSRDAYIILCCTATSFAAPAWVVPLTNVGAAAKVTPSAQLHAVVAEAQQPAAAEGEQVCFLQHSLSRVLRLMRKHAMAGVGPAAATAAAAQCNSNGGGSRGSSNSSGGSSSNGNSRSSSRSSSSDGSSPVEPLAAALLGAVGTLSAILRHNSLRGSLQTSLRAAGLCWRAGAGAATDSEQLMLSPCLIASLQECVRLGVDIEQLVPVWVVITELCAPSHVPYMLHAPMEAGLESPPGSPGQRQLFGLICTRLKSVQVAGSGPDSMKEGAHVSVQMAANWAMYAIYMHMQHTVASGRAAAAQHD
jgi:hypothetical protein